MNRKEFIKLSCLSCAGLSLGLSVLGSCSPANVVKGILTDDGISIPVTSFLKDNSNEYKDYLVINNPNLKNPICVFRISDNQYNAILLKCTHQGAELQAFGDVLQCPAHGSEFNNKGEVISGPANKELRKFPVRIINNDIHITLT